MTLLLSPDRGRRVQSLSPGLPGAQLDGRQNAVSAAATHAKIKFGKTHPSKADAARQLSARHSLPDVSSLLAELNDARKSVAYGDIAMPHLDPEDVAIEIEEYVDAVERFLGR